MTPPSDIGLVLKNSPAGYFKKPKTINERGSRLHMRYLTPHARSVLYDPIQTAAKEKSLKPNFWIFHHSTPITLKRFLETQVIDLGYADGTNADIAVRHTQMGEESDRIYVACVGNDNKLKIYYADIKIDIEKQQWFQLSIALPSPESFYAEDVAIAFDGKMPKNYDGNIEFITEQDPWLFWVYDGQCFAKKNNKTNCHRSGYIVLR